MALIVDPWHWLTPEGEIPDGDPRLRRNVLKVARVIEYGADLQENEGRETLIECTKRPNRKSCVGLLWVLRAPNDTLISFCPVCQTEHIVVHNWKDTIWAEGLAEPVPVTVNR